MKPIVEKLWEYKGYRCAVLFQPMCHRCGYIEIPKDSKYFNVAYDDIPIDVHGGLTYGRDYLSEVSKQEDGTYWIGWDYAHYMDCNDYESALEYYKDDEKAVEQILRMKEIMSYSEGWSYSQTSVECDCERVVEQLIELDNPNKNLGDNYERIKL